MRPGSAFVTHGMHDSGYTCLDNRQRSGLIMELLSGASQWIS